VARDVTMVVVNGKGRQLLRGVLHIKEGVREAPLHQNESRMEPTRLLMKGERMARCGDVERHCSCEGDDDPMVHELHQDAVAP
jgi:hypothetical protein